MRGASNDGGSGFSVPSGVETMMGVDADSVEYSDAEGDADS